MNKFLACTFLLLLAACGKATSPQTSPNGYTPISTIREWQSEHRSNQSIYQKGTVVKLLQDDNEGSRHQKFIVELENDLTLLISHNIDLAPRITSLKNGDQIEFKGEYEWNKKGGVVHWTHRDPKGNHEGGYLLHEGRKYE